LAVDYPNPSRGLRDLVAGTEIEVPVLDGTRRRYINFDNAASTPALKAVRDGIARFLDYYSSVHRGTGFKSQLATWAYEQARHQTLAFVGARPETHTCIFGKNTTEATNKLARRLGLRDGDVVLTTEMEHHSDDLPFRAVAQVAHVAVDADGRLDEADFDRLLRQHQGKVRLVAITGASNVTGYLNPLHRLAEKAHAAGALFLADCAQLAPHRAVDMRDLADPAHLDFVVLSAHKMYAPYGTGALIGRTDIFEAGEPDVRGGGTVEVVTLDSVAWAGPPDKDEAGSPNVVGAVALALALRELGAIGMPAIARHEAELTAHALRGLRRVPGVRLFGDADPERAAERLGVIPFGLDGASHFLVAAILGHEFGIGVRSGCFCAHPYVLRLLGMDRAQSEASRARILAGDRSEMPGMTRISFGLYNTIEEVDRFLEALSVVAAGGYRGRYQQDPASGEYRPDGWAPDFEAAFPLSSPAARPG
jgi:selenocysteine lyase/cysteine desulfurase